MKWVSNSSFTWKERNNSAFLVLYFFLVLSSALYYLCTYLLHFKASYICISSKMANIKSSSSAF